LTNTLLIKVTRLDTYDYGVLGHLDLEGFDCVTLERDDTLIPPGTYEVTLDKSPRLGYVCPHIRVPSRDQAAGGDAGLRIHIANWEHQLSGCIAVGEARDGQGISHSRVTFTQLMGHLEKADKLVLVIR
jgi:hypothetical protein